MNVRCFWVVLSVLLTARMFAQQHTVHIDARVIDEDTRWKLVGAFLDVETDSFPTATYETGTNGKFPDIQLPINRVYRLTFRKAGYVTKMAELNTHLAYPEDMPYDMYCTLEISLFEQVQGLDFSFLLTKPMARFSIGEGGYQVYDTDYTGQMLQAIEHVRNEEPELNLHVRVFDQRKGKSLQASMEIWQDGKWWKTVQQTETDTSLDFNRLRINHTYLLKFTAEGYVTNMVEVNTRFAAPDQIVSPAELNLRINLFKVNDKFDFSFLNTEPMTRYAYTSGGVLASDQAYETAMEQKVNAVCPPKGKAN